MATDRDGRPERLRVLIDANGFTMPVQLGIDLYGELRELLGSYEPLVLEETLEELRGIAHGRGSDAGAAKVGLALAGGATVVSSGTREGSVDERIVSYAERNRCAVLTNDAALRKELRRRGIKVISLRKFKKLEIYG